MNAYEVFVGSITPEEFVAPYSEVADDLDHAIALAIEELNKIWTVSDEAADEIRGYVISKLA
ncbi:MAG: hypothetical protein ACRC62_20410 [Microcoleus sp.]